MEEKYTYTRTTVSMINYHVIFCPRYRRKIFLIPGAGERFKELVRGKRDEKGIRIIAMERDKDHARLFLNVPPALSGLPALMRMLKGTTSRALRAEFPQLAKMPSLWTRPYFASTAGNVSSDTVKKYVESQKGRY